MSFWNGLLFVCLFAGGGTLVERSLRTRDSASVLLSLSLMVLGLAEAFEFILSAEFQPFALRGWYFLSQIFFWGVLGAGVVVNLPFERSVKRILLWGVGIGLIAGLALTILTQITVAVNWFAPEQSIFTQYVDLMARNRPTRWLTTLFELGGVGSVMLWMFVRKHAKVSRWVVTMVLGSQMLFWQETIYSRFGENVGDVIHLVGGWLLFLSIWFLTERRKPKSASSSKVGIWLSGLVVAALVGWGYSFRVAHYGDLCLASLTNDSSLFISLSGEDVFSKEFFTSNRPALITLIYKLGGVDPLMRVTAVSRPENKIPLQVYPGLNCITGVQTGVAVFSWSVLVFILVSKLRSPWLRILLPVVVLSFAYLPPLADWDRVIMSESISFSMWALFLGLSVELASRLVEDGQNVRISTWLIFLLWGISMAGYGVARDTNVYMNLLVGVSGVVGLLLPATRKRISVRLLASIALLGLSLFGLQNALLYRSDRWINPFFNNVHVRVLPDSDRTAWFVERGMPTPTPLYAYTNLLGRHDYDRSEINDLLSWTRDQGAGLYTQYLLTHPGWALAIAWKWSAIVFKENLQPYFKPVDDTVTPYDLALGEVLHPRSRLIIGVQLLILLVLGVLAVQEGSDTRIALMMLFSLFFIGELGLLFVSIHGDALGIIRHALVAVMPLRFNLWLFSLFVLDSDLASGVQEL